MKDGMGVKVVITYKNENLEVVSTREYSLAEYTEMMKLDLLKVISDVEDLVYTLTDGKQKSEWSEKTVAAFNKIKHKLLDKGNEIARMPENLQGLKPLNEFMASVFNSIKRD